MRAIGVVSIMGAMMLGSLGAAVAPAGWLVQVAAGAEQPGAKAAAAVTLRGTVAAVDREARTITLKGPKGGTLTLEVRDESKFDSVKVGDPVVATYYEAVAIVVRKAGTAAPGTSVQETRVTSKPGEVPAGAIGREVRLTGTIKAIDRAGQTVTVQGPRGGTETVKVREAKNLEGLKVGDLVEIGFTQALAVSLDRPPR
jgi:Cu/Ag efflux protein CusF